LGDVRSFAIWKRCVAPEFLLRFNAETERFRIAADANVSPHNFTVDEAFFVLKLLARISTSSSHRLSVWQSELGGEFSLVTVKYGDSPWCHALAAAAA